MKKIMTFALVALFLGFAYTANAQVEKPAKPVKPVADQTTAKEDPKVKADDWDKTIKDYEQAVDKCVELYKQMQDDGTTGKANPKEFEKALKKAENMKSTIEKSKDQLNRTQVDRFNKATKKLSQVYKKG